MDKKKLGVFASGNGTNLQAIINACDSGVLPAEVSLIISNNSTSGALERGRNHGIHRLHLSTRAHPDSDELDQAIYNVLVRNNIEFVLLAGYMKKLGKKVLSEFSNRILNIHPALLPRFGGKGMYGINVHRAVLAAGDALSGATVHLVNERYDEGPILNQRSVPVVASDTAETLQSRVLGIEHTLYVETIQRLLSREVAVVDRYGPAVIRPVAEDWEIDEAVKTIRHSFEPVARRFHLTRENCPTHPSFLERNRLAITLERGGRLISCYVDGKMIGFYALEKSRDSANVMYLERLCVRPESRHRGIGAALVNHCCTLASAAGAKRISIGLIDDHIELKRWYLSLKFIQTGTRDFEHLPFTVCFMEKSL